MRTSLFACGRCGRETTGFDCGPMGWYLEEDGWVYVSPGELMPVVPFVERDGVLYPVVPHHRGESCFVCPDCQTVEERPTGERWARIECGRCRRQQHGSLDGHDGDIEWEEDDWAHITNTSVTLGDDPRAAFVLSPAMYVCPGCLTVEEQAQLDAIRETPA